MGSGNCGGSEITRRTPRFVPHSRISGVTQITGPQTALRGMKVAAFLCFGVVLPTWATEYVFQVRTYALFAISTSVLLIGMVVNSATVGAWGKNRKSGTASPAILFPVPCSLFPVPCSLFPVP
jgi:hypothetical protein